MDVKEKKIQDAACRESEAGFTLIESMVAMALLVGVIFLLFSVFNEFLMDDYANRLNKAVLVAENQIHEVEESRNFESVNRDTIGFRVIQTVTMRDRFVLVDVAVRDSMNPRKQYIELSKALPVK